MAGIGFKLRKMVREGGLTGLIGGYVGAAVLAGGPWLVSIATMAVLARFLGAKWGAFSTVIVVTQSLSIVATSPWQFPLTRYLSDRLYAGDTGRHVLACSSAWVAAVLPTGLLFALLSALVGPGLGWVQGGFWLWLHGVALFCVSATLWMVLLFLGVVRAYKALILSFLGGNAVSLVLGWLWSGRPLQAPVNTLTGYLVGQVLLVVALLWALLAEFPGPDAQARWDREALDCLRKYPHLTALGLLYYVGLWADKGLIALTRGGPVGGADYAHICFLAQLTALPALASFFMSVETEFFEHFREFFLALKSGKSLAAIGQVKQRLLRGLAHSLRSLVYAQGTLTVVAILLTPVWLTPDLGAAAATTARFQLAGVFAQTLMFFSTIFLVYFELYQASLRPILVFAGVNLVGSLIYPHYGLAFCLGAWLGMGLALWQLRLFMPDIDRLVFARQPLTFHRIDCSSGTSEDKLSGIELGPHALKVILVEGQNAEDAYGVYTMVQSS